MFLVNMSKNFYFPAKPCDLQHIQYPQSFLLIPCEMLENFSTLLNLRGEKRLAFWSNCLKFISTVRLYFIIKRSQVLFQRFNPTARISVSQVRSFKTPDNLQLHVPLCSTFCFFSNNTVLILGLGLGTKTTWSTPLFGLKTPGSIATNKAGNVRRSPSNTWFCCYRKPSWSWPNFLWKMSGSDHPKYSWKLSRRVLKKHPIVSYKRQNGALNCGHWFGSLLTFNSGCESNVIKI